MSIPEDENDCTVDYAHFSFNVEMSYFRLKDSE